jgi:DNA repair protein RAD16
VPSASFLYLTVQCRAIVDSESSQVQKILPKADFASDFGDDDFWMTDFSPRLAKRPRIGLGAEDSNTVEFTSTKKSTIILDSDDADDADDYIKIDDSESEHEEDDSDISSEEDDTAEKFVLIVLRAMTT